MRRPIVPLPLRLILGVVAIGGAIVLGAFGATIVDPVVRRATIALPDWPDSAPPIRVALLADIHLGNASMDRARLHRIIGEVNALKPDLVIVAGDFLAGYEIPKAGSRSAQVAAELATLKAPLGVVAVLGNHDMATDPAIVTKALQHAGVTVLQNAAVHKGPLAIGGLGDGYSGNARVTEMLAAMSPLPGARIAVMHSPADAPSLPPDVTLALAGHTHCGQVTLPFYGALFLPSVPARYVCGLVVEGSRRVVVTGGLGTSTLPFRVGAPPDLWLLTLGPE